MTIIMIEMIFLLLKRGKITITVNAEKKVKKKSVICPRLFTSTKTILCVALDYMLTKYYTW